MIPESFVQDLLARVAIEDVVGRHVQLRKGGANLLGLCPFHNEKSPSFTVSPAKQFFHCFGCGANGNAVGFLMRHLGYSFPEAVKTLAAETGMRVPEEPRSPRQREAERQRKAEVSLHEQILQLAQTHYQKQLRDARPAIDYLRGRGLEGALAARYGLGWSGGGRRALATVVPDYEHAALLDTGLVIEAEDGRRHDRFRDRIMFPIRNARGHLIGFGGRLIAAGEPKYLNSPETRLFSKGHELYGLWEAREGIRKENCVLVVEGYMDVVMLAQHGLANAVATLGTATTDVHLQKLIRVSTRIVFCFDGDAAGRRAAWRALTVCLPLLRDDVAMRFLFLPDGHDPDSYVREHGVEALRTQVRDAQALSGFLFAELGARHGLNEAEGRAACIHEAAPLFAQMPTNAMRRQLEGEFARLVRLTPEELTASFQADRRSVPASRPVQEGASSMRAPERDAPASRSAIQRANAGVTARVRGAGALRRVTPLVRRLLHLLLSHPALIDGMGEQQLEILSHRPHLDLVREFIALVNDSGARHAGALLAAADPESGLGEVLASLSETLLLAEDLPDPQAEWDDALRLIELEAIKAEQSALVQGGLRDEMARRRYQELTRQLTLLGRAGSAHLQ